ncbi:unnamed protein product, partial [Prunus brigantina]
MMMNCATLGGMTQSRRKLYGNLAEPWRRHIGVNIHGLQVTTHHGRSLMDGATTWAAKPTASHVLQRNPKFKSLFDQLGFGPQAREAAAVALMNISAESNSHCFTAQPQGSFLGNDNAIVFTDEDMEVPYPDHRRPFYLEGQINDVFIRRALVDTGSSVNILPLSVLTAAGIPLSKIIQSQTSISGFGNKSEVTIGHVQVNLKVGPIRSLTKFYVVDVDVAYHALLGRPWLNKHKLVVSTYHQCVKGRIGLRPLRIPGNQAPFNKDEAHYSEAEFYTECTGARSNPSKDFGTYLPSWIEIRDLSNEELITIVDQERKRHSEVNNHAYDHPQCSKAPMPCVFQEPMTAPRHMQDGLAAVAEQLETIDLSEDPSGPRPISISVHLTSEERAALISLLKEFRDLLAAGFIKPIKHPTWLANIVPVKKKTGVIRICTDYRDLNRACRKDEFPLPNMDILIDA